jgi:hypothetical protein
MAFSFALRLGNKNRGATETQMPKKVAISCDKGKVRESEEVVGADYQAGSDA